METNTKDDKAIGRMTQHSTGGLKVTELPALHISKNNITTNVSAQFMNR